MPFETVPLSELDHLAWSELQQVVRSFRDALRQAERPEIESYAPAPHASRQTVLVELIHEVERGVRAQSLATLDELAAMSCSHPDHA